jgi:hypothetical protein
MIGDVEFPEGEELPLRRTFRPIGSLKRFLWVLVIIFALLYGLLHAVVRSDGFRGMVEKRVVLPSTMGTDLSIGRLSLSKGLRLRLYDLKTQDRGLIGGAIQVERVRLVPDFARSFEQKRLCWRSVVLTGIDLTVRGMSVAELFAGEAEVETSGSVLDRESFQTTIVQAHQALQGGATQLFSGGIPMRDTSIRLQGITVTLQDPAGKTRAEILYGMVDYEPGNRGILGREPRYRVSGTFRAADRNPVEAPFEVDVLFKKGEPVFITLALDPWM